MRNISLKSSKLYHVSHKFLRIKYLFKRLVDYLTAILMLIVLSPILIVIAIAIKLDSPGEVLFKQTRVGLNEKHFKIWKFRTMVTNSEHLRKELKALNEVEGGVVFKIRNDPRITKIGKFLRNYSLDEIPQLFNVLFGDMSLVAPRPLPLKDISKMNSSPKIRHKLLPGISGLTQVNGRSQCSSDEFFYWDQLYVKQWSL